MTPLLTNTNMHLINLPPRHHYSIVASPLYMTGLPFPRRPKELPHLGDIYTREFKHRERKAAFHFFLNLNFFFFYFFRLPIIERKANFKTYRLK